VSLSFDQPTVNELAKHKHLLLAKGQNANEPAVLFSSPFSVAMPMCVMARKQWKTLGVVSEGQKF